MDVPRHWRLLKQRYTLAGEICPQCQTAIFPPRAVCPTCSKEHKDFSIVKNEVKYSIDAEALKSVAVKA